MADVNLTQQDIDYIARVVDTEVPRSIARTNPAEYERMVQAVTDTVVNRVASDRFPNSVTGVLNQNRQFSKVTGPSRLDPYGSVQRTPRAPADVRTAVSTHIANRVQGTPSIIGGAVNYANPNVSDRSNLNGWVNPMIEAGARAFGVGQNVHYHGNAPGMPGAGAFTLAAEAMPGGDIPTPRDRNAAPQSQAAYGIMGAVDPVRVGEVERGILGPVQPREEISMFDNERFGPAPSTERFDRGRFGVEGNVGRRDLAQALAEQQAAMREASATPNTSRTAQQVSPQAMANAGAEASARGAVSMLSPDQQFAKEIDDYRTSIGKSPVNAGLLGPIGAVDPITTTAAGPVQQPQQMATQPQVVQPQAQAAPSQGTMGGPGLSGRNGGLLGNLFGGQVNGRNMVGGIGGGLLGGALLGPLGALAGGLLGRTIASRTAPMDANFFPNAPSPVMGSRASSGGYESLSDYGRDAYSNSQQVRDVVDNNSPGLW